MRRTRYAILITTVCGTATTVALAFGPGGFDTGDSTDVYGGGGEVVPDTQMPDSIELTGVVRDFKTSHPDFETFPGGDFASWNEAGQVYAHLVKDQLGEDGKPVFNDGLLSDRSWSDIPLENEQTFNQWFRDVPGVNTSWLHTITLERQEDGSYFFAQEKPNYFFIADGLGYGNSEGPLRWAQPYSHNYHFTYELEMEFTYTDPSTRDNELEFTFTGDDDVWVFVNGHLACDIGGVHGQASRSVNIDDRAADFGLDVNENYQLKLFFAERHTSESNFRIETTLTLRKSELPPTAGLFD